jgi:SAM-dependent methyltransferase
MSAWLVPARRNTPELMDAAGLDPAEVAGAYRALERVNRQLGNLRTIQRELDRFVGESRLAGTLDALDLGAGAGDVAAHIGRLARDQGLAARVIALDLDPTALGLCRTRGVAAVRADALRLPFADRSVDLVTAVKFAHHFEGPGLLRLLAEMARVARRRVLLLDIRRHWLAYAGFVAWSRVFTRNRLVRNDGPISVLRGFTRGELGALAAGVAGLSWTVRAYAPFQLALVGTRPDGDSTRRDRPARPAGPA